MYLSCLDLSVSDILPLVGGKCASPRPVVRTEKGQHWDSLPLCHAHHLCREQPGDTQGVLGEQRALSASSTQSHLRSYDVNPGVLSSFADSYPCLKKAVSM